MLEAAVIPALAVVLLCSARGFTLRLKAYSHGAPEIRLAKSERSDPRRERKPGRIAAEALLVSSGYPL